MLSYPLAVTETIVFDFVLGVVLLQDQNGQLRPAPAVLELVPMVPR